MKATPGAGRCGTRWGTGTPSRASSGFAPMPPMCAWLRQRWMGRCPHLRLKAWEWLAPSRPRRYSYDPVCRRRHPHHRHPHLLRASPSPWLSDAPCESVAPPVWFGWWWWWGKDGKQIKMGKKRESADNRKETRTPPGVGVGVSRWRRWSTSQRTRSRPGRTWQG